MIASRRWFEFVSLFLFFAFLLAECEFNSPELGSLDNSIREGEYRTLTGKTIGTESVIWSVNEQSVTCTDEAAPYEMTLVQSFEKLPEDSHLQEGAISKGLEYFRLDVNGVEHILEKGQCLMRDPSDDRVHTLIEGSYNPENYTFTVLSCSLYGLPSSSEMYYSSANVVQGTITCNNGDQKKTVFEFANLELH
jgi:hypothetical protein